MSAYDETRAVQALAFRLREWDVPEADEKAREFIDALVGVGWRMAPERETRPSPPKPHEACKECGRALHAADRVCDRPTVRPLTSVPPSVAYLNLRRPSGRQTTPEQGDAS